MNQVVNAIMQRRSIRNYTDQNISEEALKTIIQAGLYAPSAVNEQTWHFSVIRSKEKINSLNQDVKESLRKSEVEWIRELGATETFHVFYNAPAVVLVSLQKNATNSMADISAAIQNMLIAAHSLGIGSCWIGMTAFHYKNPETAHPSFVPESHEPLYAVALGYAKGEPQDAPERRAGTVIWLD